MEFADYYSTLGVPRDADAAAIKSAYRKLARTLHPDVSSEPGAEARFKKVNEAYEVLKDPQKRARYDRLGKDWDRVVETGAASRQGGGRAPSSAGEPGAFSDFFETFFASGVDLDELLGGVGVRGGRAPFGGRRGHGAAPRAAPRPRRGVDIEESCDVSLGEAIRGGVRLLTVGERQVEVRIPAGVTHGSRVRVAGEGGEGGGGGERGDVILRVRVRPDGRWTVRDRDVIGELAVRDDQAALGATVTVEAPTGPLQVRVPAHSQAGRTLRLRGKGIPGLRDAAAGDLLLTVRVDVPPAITDEERDLYRRLSELRAER